MKPTDTLPLSMVEAGQTVTLVDILASRRSGQRLAELGLTSKTPITVLQSMPGQPLLIRVRGSRLALDRAIADQICVRVIDLERRGGPMGRHFHRHRHKRHGARRNAFRFLGDRVKRGWRRRPHLRRRSRERSQD
jgi:Fe2+ transport system protein FeoA